MSLGNITSIVEGVGYGLNLSEMKRLGDSMYAGRNIWSGTMFQTAQVGSTLALSELALQAGGLPAVSTPLSAVLYLTPAVLALATRFLGQSEEQAVPRFVGQSEEQAVQGAAGDQLWRSIAIFIQDQISNLCQVAAILASIALIYFGSILLGAASLAMLGVGVLDYYAVFPECVRQLLHEYSPPVLFLTALITGSGANIIFSGFNIISYCMRRYSEYVEAHREIPPVPEDAMMQAYNFLNQEFPLEVNPNYIFWPTVARATSDIDIQILVNQFREIDWTRNIATLRLKFKNDARFRDRHGDPASYSDQALIQIAEQKLRACITLVKGQSGTVRNSEKLKEYMQFIAHEIQKRRLQQGSIDMESCDILLRLAVEAGDYCGPGVFQVAEEIYAGLIGGSTSFTIRDKVLNCLQALRNRTMEGIHAHIFALQQNEDAERNSWGLMAGLNAVVQFNDRHNIHLFQNMFGGQFGLLTAAAQNDDLAVADPLMGLMVSCLFGNQVETMFWQRHNLNEIVNAVKETIGTPGLPKGELYEWWLETWVRQPGIRETEQQILLEEFNSGVYQGEPKLLGKNMEDQGRMADVFVRAMLLGMGVLRPAL